VYRVHRRVSIVGRVISLSLHGASEETTEVLVQVGKEGAGDCEMRVRGGNLDWLTIAGNCRHRLACSS
jgi:serine protease inhibitor ecotin